MELSPVQIRVRPLKNYLGFDDQRKLLEFSEFKSGFGHDDLVQEKGGDNFWIRSENFWGAEFENADLLRDGKVFSLNYEELNLESYTYDPPIAQKAADFLNIAPTPDFIVEVKNGSETSYFEATRRGAKEILQRPQSEFQKTY